MNLKNQFDQLTPLMNDTENCKVWAIGGGKGGVGKSLVTANTSICLALMKRALQQDFLHLLLLRVFSSLEVFVQSSGLKNVV